MFTSSPICSHSQLIHFCTCVITSLKCMNDREIASSDRVIADEVMGPIFKLLQISKNQLRPTGTRDAKAIGRRMITPSSNIAPRNYKMNNSEQSLAVANEIVQDLIQSSMNTYCLSKTFDIVSELFLLFFFTKMNIFTFIL